MTVQTRGIAWPLVVSQACDINTDTSCHRTTNPDMAPGSSMGSDVPIASTCYMVAAQTIDILLAFGGNSRHRHRHRHKHRHQLQQDHGPRCGPQQQPPPGPHPGLFICLILTIFKSSFHLSPFRKPLPLRYQSLAFLTPNAELSKPALGGGSLCTPIRTVALVS